MAEKGAGLGTHRRRSGSGCRWLSQQNNNLERAGLVYNNLQAVFASVTKAMPKGEPFHMVTDYRGVNQALKAVPWLYPNSEQVATFFAGAGYCATLKLLQGG